MQRNTAYFTCGRPRPGRGKYGVSEPARRTYNDVVYHSLAEARRAQLLDLLIRGGQVRAWKRQVRFELGTLYNVYVVDFVVEEADGAVHAEDVKGYETREFKKNARLWAAFGPIPLWILTPGGASRWKVKIIDPDTQPAKG